MDDELKPNAGLHQNQESPVSEPKSEVKSQLGRKAQQPTSATGNIGSPSLPRIQIFDNPSEFGSNPLKEGAHGRVEKAISEIEKGNTSEAFQSLDPTASKEKSDAFAYAFDNTVDGEPIGEDVKQEMINKWKQSNTSQEEAKGFIQGSNLSSEEKVDMNERIDKELAQKTGAGEEEERSGTEREQMQANQANIKASQEFLNESVSKIDEEIAKTTGNSSHDDEHIKKFERTREKIKELQEKMDEFLHPEDPLKTWSMRGGLVLYYTLLTAFIFIIWEMNLINKMVAKR